MTDSIPVDPFETFVQEKPIEVVEFASFSDYEMEYQVLGSIMRKSSIFDDVEAELKVDMFHNVKCQYIFGAMQKIRGNGLIIDAITVADQLDRDGLLSEIQYDVFSGRAAISAIREKGNPKNVMSYVELVKDYWGKRKLDILASTMSNHARNGRRSVDIIADTRKEFDAIDLESGNVSSKTYSNSQSASMLYDHVDKAARGEIVSCPTGFVDLDRLISPSGGDLVIVGGRPGQGKSTLLDSIAMNLMRENKKRVGFFTLEMSAKQVNARFASHLSGIPAERILKGKIADNEWPSFTNAIEELEHLPFAINDQSGLNISQLRVAAKKIIKQLGGLDMLILDYIQLMKAMKKYRNRNEEIGEFTKGLKEIGKELDVPILAAAQMSRAVDQRSEKRPILSDLRESGDLENDADIVMFIYRPNEVDSDKQNITEIIVAKHRNGPLGSVELLFRGSLTKFENVELRRFAPNERAQWQDRKDN